MPVNQEQKMNVFYRCRLCLRPCRKKIDVFKDDFPKMIEILTGIMVEPYDTFPATSCLDCARNVKLALKIRKQIIKSHKVLIEEFLVKTKPKNNKDVKIVLNKKGDLRNETVDILSETKENTSLKEPSSFDIDEPFCNDSDQHLPSPVSVSEKIESNDDHQQNNEATDTVVFVQKPKSTTVKKNSPDTIVRIKKKKLKSTPQRVTCTICNKEVQSYWLQKHMETHSYNPVTCEFCGLVSKSSTALRHHVFYYHKSAADEYMCDQCGRHFRSKYRLNLHKKKEHGGTKDFECTTCGKRFFERMHLKRHIDKTHKNIRPYVCDFCGKSFKSINHIRVHERIHSKESPYTCHICAESFKMKLTLRSHLRGIHNIQEEEKVFCDICRRGFASEVALKAHVNSRIHETEKCQYCSEMFTTEYMVNHLKDVHGTELGVTS